MPAMMTAIISVIFARNRIVMHPIMMLNAITIIVKSKARRKILHTQNSEYLLFVHPVTIRPSLFWVSNFLPRALIAVAISSHIAKCYRNAE